MMTKFELAKGGKLIGKVSEYRAKKLETKNTAFKLDVVTAKGKDGKMHECFILTNKKGVATPLLKSISIDLEHYLGATTKKCLCETLPTKDQKLGYIYVDLQTGNVSEAFDVVGRGHDHKNDYAIGEDKTIKIVSDDLTLTDSEYVYVGRPTSSDLKSYTRDAGFVVRHIPTGEYGVVSTFGRTDGAIKVLCPPVFDDPKIGHRTISTEKYNFLYEYFTSSERVLADTCYGLALQKVKANEEFRVGDNIQRWRAEHPAVEESREKESRRFQSVVERGEEELPKKSVVERIKDRHEEIKQEIAMARVAKAIKDTHYVSPARHISQAMMEADLPEDPGLRLYRRYERMMGHEYDHIDDIDLDYHI